MQNPVVIKGNKAGMTVYLDPALPFTELLEAVKKKRKPLKNGKAKFPIPRAFQEN